MILVTYALGEERDACHDAILRHDNGNLIATFGEGLSLRLPQISRTLNRAVGRSVASVLHHSLRTRNHPLHRPFGVQSWTNVVAGSDD